MIADDGRFNEVKRFNTMSFYKNKYRVSLFHIAATIAAGGMCLIIHASYKVSWTSFVSISMFNSPDQGWS